LVLPDNRFLTVAARIGPAGNIGNSFIRGHGLQSSGLCFGFLRDYTEPSNLWECGNRSSDFQGRWEGWKS